MTIISVLVKK